MEQARFNLITEITDDGEQVVRADIDVSGLGSVDPDSVLPDTFEVLTSVSVPPGVSGPVGEAFSGVRTVEAVRVEDGQIRLFLRLFEDGAKTVGFSEELERSVPMEVNYSINQRRPFQAGASSVLLADLSMDQIVHPETQKFVAGTTSGGIDYRLYVPDNPEGAPLVVWFHGLGEGAIKVPGVEDNSVQITANLGGVALITPEAQTAFGGRAVVVAPQAPTLWSESTPEGYLADLHRLFGELVRRYGLDASRLYVVGASMGGYMTIRYTSEFPESVAAAVAIAPGLKKRGMTEDQVLRVAGVPTWFVHSKDDEIVMVDESLWAHGLLAPLGESHLSLYDQVVRGGRRFSGHHSWIYTLRNEPTLPDGTTIWDWVGRQRL